MATPLLLPILHAYGGLAPTDGAPSPGARRPPAAEEAIQGLGAMLLADGIVPAHHLVPALALHSQRRGRLIDVLLARGVVGESALYRAIARHWQAGLLDLAAEPPDAGLMEAGGATRCLQERMLPWRRVGEATVIATAYPEEFEARRAALAHRFGPVIMALAPARAIEAAILRNHGQSLALRAETRVAAGESCRNFSPVALLAPLVLVALAGIESNLLWPHATFAVLTGLAFLAMLGFGALKFAAALAVARHPAPIEPAPHIARLPVVSVIVALYRESSIAPRLVRRLEALNYPRELLDVVLAVEADDALTRDALAGADLPSWMRVVAVPAGSIKTKPRALNFALDHCRGSIIGIYDAEDAPEPEQIRDVVNRFHQRGPEVACLQGMLDFYNPRTNWLSRCFTIEYACWFRLLLPGIERLGLAVPLGGTTLFFHRAALESLGAWDAHNVTEDADLGIRLARHGYRTEVIETVTHEEACCRALPWIKQRSRWIKGFMMTWACHMRNPRLLWRQLGPRRFAGFQILLLGSVVHALMAPVLWSFWLVPLGFAHPLASALPPGIFAACWITLFTVEALNIAFGIYGLSRTRHRLRWFWVPTLYFYQPLATFAAYKAAWEMLSRPFYWDKTSHGHFDSPTAPGLPPQPRLAPAKAAR